MCDPVKQGRAATETRSWADYTGLSRHLFSLLFNFFLRFSLRRSLYMLDDYRYTMMFRLATNAFSSLQRDMI